MGAVLKGVCHKHTAIRSTSTKEQLTTHKNTNSSERDTQSYACVDLKHGLEGEALGVRSDRQLSIKQSAKQYKMQYNAFK
jgi:hypothetical protein